MLHIYYNFRLYRQNLVKYFENYYKIKNKKNKILKINSKTIAKQKKIKIQKLYFFRQVQHFYIEVLYIIYVNYLHNIHQIIILADHIILKYFSKQILYIYSETFKYPRSLELCPLFRRFSLQKFYSLKKSLLFRSVCQGRFNFISVYCMYRTVFLSKQRGNNV